MNVEHRTVRNCSEERLYCVLMATAFIVFLIIALPSRLLPRSMRPFASVTKSKETVIADARRMAGTYVPMAFLR